MFKFYIYLINNTCVVLQCTCTNDCVQMTEQVKEPDDF